MNDLESQIVSAIAARRGLETPRHSKLALGQDRRSRGASPQFQNRPPYKGPNVMGSAGACGDLRNPWPDRPRISRRSSSRLEAARSVASRPLVIACMVLFMATGLMNVAHKGDSEVRVVVHTLWPL